MSLTDSVSENILLTFDNSDLVLYVALSVATEIQRIRENSVH